MARGESTGDEGSKVLTGDSCRFPFNFLWDVWQSWAFTGDRVGDEVTVVVLVVVVVVVVVVVIVVVLVVVVWGKTGERHACRWVEEGVVTQSCVSSMYHTEKQFTY
jgi:hypothetical protein